MSNNKDIRCKGHTHGSRYPYPMRDCYNKQWKDGYCKIHHPEEKTRRLKERYAKKDAQHLKPKHHDR